MSISATALVVLAGALHLLFAFMEAFKWEILAKRLLPQPDGEGGKDLSADVLDATGLMAKNTAIYNAFVGLGFFWSLTLGEALQSSVAMFFFVFIAGVGVVGYLTTRSWLILVAQTALGLLGLVLVSLS